MYALVLFVQITVLATFSLCMHFGSKTIGIIGPLSPPLVPFIRASTVLLSYYILFIFIALCSEYSQV
jgi:hypothetical protein